MQADPGHPGLKKYRAARAKDYRVWDTAMKMMEDNKKLTEQEARKQARIHIDEKENQTKTIKVSAKKQKGKKGKPEPRKVTVETVQSIKKN